MQDFWQGLRNGLGYIAASILVGFFLRNSGLFVVGAVIALLGGVWWKGPRLAGDLKNRTNAFRTRRNAASDDVQRFLDRARQHGSNDRPG
jgi:ABC-type transport system involved in cytochrome c biogenesis permease subunit